MQDAYLGDKQMEKKSTHKYLLEYKENQVLMSLQHLCIHFC